MITLTVGNYKSQANLSKYLNSIDKDTNYFIVEIDNKISSIIAIKYLGWDSDIFNKKIGSFDVCYGDLKNNYVDEIMSKINDFCIEEKYDCLFAKSSTEDYPMMHILEGNGYRLMDSIITLKTSLKSKLYLNLESEYKIRVLKESDISSLLNIIDNLYSFGRFFEDSNLDNDDVNTLYKRWITNEIRNENVDVLGIEKDDRLLGFISCKYRYCLTDKNKEGIISLVGIDKLYQGMGIGKKLMNCVLNHFCDKGINDIYVGTQINNLSSLNFYISTGFRINSSFSSFHKWF